MPTIILVNPKRAGDSKIGLREGKIANVPMSIVFSLA